MSNDVLYNVKDCWDIIIDNLSGSLGYENSIFLKGYMEGYLVSTGTDSLTCENKFILELVNFLVNK